MTLVKEKKQYDVTKEKPVVYMYHNVSWSAGFLDLETQKYEEVCRLADSRDLDWFMEAYDLSVINVCEMQMAS